MNDAARIYKMTFTSVYPLYLKKVVRKGRTPMELDRVILWLTGYSSEALARHIEAPIDFESFFRQSPALHPNASKITGVVCGVRVEEIEDPVVKFVRQLDKLVDELAKGRPLEKILRV